MITDNTNQLECPSGECLDTIPTYLVETDDGETLCGVCERVLIDAEGCLTVPDEPDYEAIWEGRRQDLDAAYHRSNFYDITSRR